MNDNDKLDRLVSYVERWLNGGTNRNQSLLARRSGINSQTIRRIMQRENFPELETTLAILNVVASPSEAMEILADRPSLVNFIGKMAALKSEESKDEVTELVLKLNNRERFWVYMTALTVGVTREIISELSGEHGLYELERMIDEKLLFEKIPGVYVAALKSETLVIENKEIYSQAPGYIAEVALLRKAAQKLYLVYNVTEEDYETIVRKIFNVYSECEEIARKSNGHIMLASSFVTTKVLGES